MYILTHFTSSKFGFCTGTTEHDIIIIKMIARDRFKD